LLSKNALKQHVEEKKQHVEEKKQHVEEKKQHVVEPVLREIFLPQEKMTA
jgi:hypothetical protein